MNTATHYENANFLRELAEGRARRTLPAGQLSSRLSLQRLEADDELFQAQHDEWVRRQGGYVRPSAARHEHCTTSDRS